MARFAWEQLIERATRVANLDGGVYAELERDPDATGQAAVAAAVASLAVGLGAGLRTGSLVSVLFAGIGSFMGWLAMAALIYLVAVQLFDRPVSLGSVLRPVGLALAPSALLLLQFLPVFGGIVVAASVLWVLATGFLASRHATGLSTPCAVAAAVVGWMAWIVLALIVGAGIPL